MDDGPQGMCDDSPGDGEKELTMDQTMQVPGVFHAINNLDARMLAQLPLWEKHHARTNSAAHFFHFRHTRDCYTETCLVGDRIT